MSPTPVVFIPALLCDGGLYKDVIEKLGDKIEPHVLISPKPRLEKSVADILARAPAQFALVGTSYGGNLALEIALTAPERVTHLWLMGCDPAGPKAGGPDLAGGLTAAPDAVIGMLAALVVHPEATAAKAEFIAMAGRLGAAAGAAQAAPLSVRNEQASRLGKLTMPCLALWGAEDALAPPSIGRKLAADLPHAHFVELAGCGHLPTLEAPERSAALFEGLLANSA